MDQVPDVGSETRHRAFAVWVALFDLAEVVGGGYVIERSAHEVAGAVGVSRPSWLEYRDVLEAAGLVRVGPFRGPHPQMVTLLPPTFT